MLKLRRATGHFVTLIKFSIYLSTCSHGHVASGLLCEESLGSAGHFNLSGKLAVEVIIKIHIYLNFLHRMDDCKIVKYSKQCNLIVMQIANLI